ncbi:MAG: DNA adenine methylase [Flavobacteriales bacterium]|jgi:adenine-specific DNA-methyltransferase|nr:DNA adenine methylase [Flavobacteriales bacterium]
MGSKRNILDFVVEAIDDVLENENQRLYDVFGGSAVVSGAYRNKLNVTCNDIQTYTSILAGTYLKNYDWNNYSVNLLDEIITEAEAKVLRFKKANKDFKFDYSNSLTFQEIKKLEEKQQSLLNFGFNGLDHLFAKNFSGTYWSYEQCVWIDALSGVARSEKYRNTFIYNAIMSSLMFAMSYCTQSTGHYAQYRDVNESNMKDILFYRRKEVLPLFKQKFNSLRETFHENNPNRFEFEATQLDFSELLDNIEEGSIVYSDPPYQFVHYSRFYHALETLARYDYPEVKYKGRYRTDRHQSPFCIKTKVKNAFETMFEKVFNANSTLILSYSDTGMISLEKLLSIAETIFLNYNIEIREIDYKHSTMGRQGDKSRNVKEALIICSPNN